MSNALTPITQAQRMLAEAQTFDDLRKLAAFAKGAKAWAHARNLGVEAENEAAEVVLRAERGLGLQLRRLADEGLYGRGSSAAKLRGRGNAGKLADAIRAAGRPLTTSEVATKAGLDTRTAAKVLYASPIFVSDLPEDRERKQGGAAGLQPRWTVDEDEVDKAKRIETLDSLGINASQAASWQSLARIPDEVFDDLLSAVKEGGGRLSKVSLYEKKKGTSESPRTKDEPGWVRFQTGAYELLGWATSEDGSEGHATKNLFLQLPSDQLKLAADLLMALVEAYKEARAAR